MAKKRRQRIERKEGDVPFRFPDFDENKFMEDEIRAAKTTFIAAGLGILWAIIAASIMFYENDMFSTIFLLGLMFGFSMRFIFPAAKIHLENIEWKSWLGSYAVYFFTMISVWILLINPPVMDLQNPAGRPYMDIQLLDEEGMPVENVGETDPVWEYTDGWHKIRRGDWQEPAIGTITPPANIRIQARLVDNSALDKDSVVFRLYKDEAGARVLMQQESMEYLGNGRYEIFVRVDESNRDDWTDSDGAYDYHISFKDQGGRGGSTDGSFLLADTWAGREVTGGGGGGDGGADGGDDGTDATDGGDDGGNTTDGGDDGGNATDGGDDGNGTGGNRTGTRGAVPHSDRSGGEGEMCAADCRKRFFY